MNFTPASAVVWTEIPVADIDAAVAFYNAVFDYGLTVDRSGPNPKAVLPSREGGTAGHLYPGTPAAGSGPTIHLAVPDTIEATAARLKAAGGSVTSDPIPLPMGRFAYATDPDGTSLGLFQASPA